MRGVDSNVLIRLITRDDPGQLAAANAFIENGVWAPTLTLAETVGVLRSVCRAGPADVAAAIELLLNIKTLVLQDSDAVGAALDLFRARPALGFSDCLMLELGRKAGHLPLGTIDRGLGKVDGAQRL